MAANHPRSAGPARGRGNPVARSGWPRSTTAAGAVVGGGAVYALTDGLGNGLTMQAVVFLVVAALGLVLPSLRLTDPTTRQPLTRDSSLTSIILSLASAFATAYAAGDLPVPDEMRGLFAALLAALTATHVPSLLGTAVSRPASRAELRDRT
jgi:hypothetical protein